MDTYRAVQDLQGHVADLLNELAEIRVRVEELEEEVFGVQPGGEDGTDWDEIGDAEEEDYLVFTPEGGEPEEVDLEGPDGGVEMQEDPWTSRDEGVAF